MKVDMHHYRHKTMSYFRMRAAALLPRYDAIKCCMQWLHFVTKRQDTRCFFDVRSKADISQLNLPHGTKNRTRKNEIRNNSIGYALK